MGALPCVMPEGVRSCRNYFLELLKGHRFVEAANPSTGVASAVGMGLNLDLVSSPFLLQKIRNANSSHGLQLRS